MLNLVVRQTPWDDNIAVRAAWEAAVRLMEEYSLMAFVDVVNETIGHNPFHDEPIIEVGRHEIYVDPATIDEVKLVDTIVQTALEEAGVSVEVPSLIEKESKELEGVPPLLLA
ncbi:MAG: hypothetical protein ACP5HK_02765 [Acidilobus sp.]